MYENSRDTTCGETAKFKIKVFLSMLCDRSQAVTFQYNSSNGSHGNFDDTANYKPKQPKE